MACFQLPCLPTKQRQETQLTHRSKPLRFYAEPRGRMQPAQLCKTPTEVVVTESQKRQAGHYRLYGVYHTPWTVSKARVLHSKTRDSPEGGGVGSIWSRSARNASVGIGISGVVEQPGVENRSMGCHKLSRCTHLVMSILESCGSRGNSAIFRPNLVSSCDAGVDPGGRLVR